MNASIPTTPAKSPLANRSRASAGSIEGGRLQKERTLESGDGQLKPRNTRLGAFAGILDEEQVNKVFSDSLNGAKYFARSQSNRAGAGSSKEISDIAQESATRALESLAKSGEVPENLSAYTMTIAKHVVADFTPTGKRGNSSDRAATAQLFRWKEEFAGANGREASSVEVEEKRKSIISNWVAQANRPSRNFDQVNGRLAPIALEQEQAEMLASASYPGNNNEEPSFEPDSPMGDALAAVIEKELAEAGVVTVHNPDGETPKIRERMAAMRRGSWNAFAESIENLPQMQAKSINPRRASVIRASVAVSGGVLAVCKQWSEIGDSDASAALFAPFGKLDFPEQERVVDFLTSNQVNKFGGGTGAETLWFHAVTGATNRKRAGD